MSNYVVRCNKNDTRNKFSNIDKNNTSHNSCSREPPPATKTSNNSIALRDFCDSMTIVKETFNNASTVTDITETKNIHTIRNSLKCDKKCILITNNNNLVNNITEKQALKNKHKIADDDEKAHDCNKNLIWPRDVADNSRGDFPLNYNEKVVHSYHSTASLPTHCYRNRDCCRQEENVLCNKRTVNFINTQTKLSTLLRFCTAILLINLNFNLFVNAGTFSNENSLKSRSIKTSETDLPTSLDYNAIDNNYGGDLGKKGHYTHTWAVHIPNGDSGLADEVARDHGFINLGKIFEDYYHFAHHKISKRSLNPAVGHQTRFESDERVHWAEQQRAKSRQKRDFIRMRPSRTSSRASLVDAVNLNDPKWPQMWYLNRGGGLDMNVIPAWKEGITGKGIVVTILDDGLESDHPDIEDNYDPDASYDVNSHDNDPMPHYDMTDSNRHGTRCAGEVAAVANNSKCAVGIAYGARVGGVRMLDGDVTDAVEARSLSLNPQHIDIYSASWGPDDDGKTVDGPGDLASRAFLEGVTKGRNGKGSIFIWASGNGGRELDNCNCDGYTNSIWTLSISSATEDGHVPWYSEKCSSTLATTYSSGGQSEKQVVTTDLHHSCTVSHTGTSASAPLAAGIAALVLQSNQNLTWRDLQHIVVRTAKPANLKDPTWTKNGVGRRISHSFGYGLMDAAAMVKVARNWKTVPEQQRCEINAPHVNKVIPPKSYITLQLSVQHCSAVNYLEHVQAKITLSSQRRGDIQLFLKSPAGTKVTLLTSRTHDVSRSGFNQWPFMSVHTWGESPHGNWQLEIHNDGRYLAQITQWDLVFHGTDIPAQPDDPVQKNMEQFSEFANEMENNDIEFDSSGQWRNMQQIGESELSTNDKTNSACLNSTIDHKCLVCAAPTYLFKGHCYITCPHHTYPNKYSQNQVIPLLTDENNIATSFHNSIEQQNNILDNVNTTENVASSIIYRECSICDASCYDCYGSLNSQCSTCYPGSQLRKQLLTNETYCYIYAERSSGNSRDGNNFNDESDYANGGRLMRSHVALLLLIVASVIILLSLIFVITLYKRQMYLRRGTGNVAVYAYDRVALLPDNNDELQDVDNGKEHQVYVETANNNSSISDLSEEEDDLFVRT